MNAEEDGLSVTPTSTVHLKMVYIKDWNEFSDAAEEMFQTDPEKVNSWFPAVVGFK